MDPERLRRLLDEIDDERSRADAAMRFIGPGRRPLEIRNAAEEARRRLQTVGRILGLAREEEDVNRRELIRLVPAFAVSPAAVERIAAAHATDDSLLRAYEEVLESASLAYPSANMHRLHALLETHVQRMAERLRGAGSEGVRARLAKLTSETAALAASVALTVGQRGSARESVVLAERAAFASGDTGAQALALEARSTLHSEVFLGGWGGSRPALESLRRALGLLDASSPAMLRQWVLARYAREAAAAGDERYERALESAAALPQTYGEHPRGLYARGGFLRFAGSRLLDVQALGRVRAGRGDDAEHILNEQIAATPVDATRRRSVLLTYLADAHTVQREPEQAARTALRALDLARPTGSALQITRVGGVASRLARWTDLPAVRDLQEALAAG
jgi:hypothetical protein